MMVCELKDPRIPGHYYIGEQYKAQNEGSDLLGAQV